jgi:Male sterility protein
MAPERSRRDRSVVRFDRSAPDTLVTGGTGFIGRWLLVELTRREQAVAVVLRPPVARFMALQAWVSERGGNGARLVAAHGDLEVAGLGLDEATDESLAGIRDVLSLAGRFEFGLDERQACRANVDAPSTWPGGRPAQVCDGSSMSAVTGSAACLPPTRSPCRARRGVASTPSSAATRPPSARVTPPLHLPSTPLTADLPATGRSSPTSASASRAGKRGRGGVNGGSPWRRRLGRR